MKFKKSLPNKLLINQTNFSWLWLMYYYNTTKSIHMIETTTFLYFNFKTKFDNRTIIKPSLIVPVYKDVDSLEYCSKRTVKKHTNSTHLNSFYTLMNLSMAPYAKYSRPHSAYLLLFMTHTREGSFTLNLKRSYMRWQNTYLLIYNLFYYDYDLMICGNKVFKIDILALNTLFCKHINTFYKYAILFYQFKESIYGANLTSLIKLVKTLDIEAAFVSDLTNNEKMATNLLICDVFTLGIVAFADNPWVLSYPVPVHSNGMFTQYYFIRNLYHIRQQAMLTRYNNFFKLWNNF